MADRPQVPNWNNINANKPEEYSSEFVVGNIRYANVTNASTGQRQLYLVSGLGGTPLTQRSLISSTNSDGTVTKGEGYDSFVRQFGQETLRKAESANKQQSIRLLSTPGVSTQTESQLIKNSKEFKSTPAGNNSAGQEEGGDNPGGNTPSQESEDFGKELGTLKTGTRIEYGNIKYPENLSAAHQDCIKFTILQYQPSLSTSTQENFSSKLSRDVTDLKGKTILGSITLPIPAGINDNNTVSWQEDAINDLQSALANAVTSYMTGGTEAATPIVNNAANAARQELPGGEVQQGIAATIAKSLFSAGNIQQRKYGTIFNNNLELLFTSPSLRNFSFTFKLSPRNHREAKDIMKIIRYFKQAMSVKRSQASLLLKTPHTFAISYLTSNQQHPYLNKFKECALTGFNVDYTPEGQYMTYMSSKIDERSMISYNISLQFQELEPVFDDEYGNESADKILNIGY